MLRQLLLLPLLAPLLAVLVVGAFNPRPAVRLRLLTYTSPPVPIGLWMMIAASGGALLSAGATSLALRHGGSLSSQRQVRLPLDSEPSWAEPDPRSASASRDGPWTRPSGGEQPPRRWAGPEAVAAGPSRAPGEPPPTVEVPFRVIRRPTDSVSAESRAGGGGPAPDDWDETGSDW